jgi:hypothetical protein
MEFLSQKQQMLTRLKNNLAQAQSRIKKYADLKRSKKHSLWGTWYISSCSRNTPSYRNPNQVLKLQLSLKIRANLRHQSLNSNSKAKIEDFQVSV